MCNHNYISYYIVQVSISLIRTTFRQWYTSDHVPHQVQQTEVCSGKEVLSLVSSFLGGAREDTKTGHPMPGPIRRYVKHVGVHALSCPVGFPSCDVYSVRI